eukprot:TRINITY_DN10450_c0_g1_i1.p1 TRINITY_DN10450_c0_g1~~TRINITY_DN10450_c0_g1_i1.p1  ORF type:complete len:296 (+),score=72.50 TRINITY_DN10450_c0_g1_i1:769-1656(+)
MAKALLTQTLISDLDEYVPFENLITVSVNDTVGDAFKKIVSARIQSVPVLDEFGYFAFFLDVIDFVNFVMEEFVGEDIDEGSEIFNETLCSEIKARYDKDTVIGVQADDNMLKAMRTMISLSSIKRLPVVSLSGNMEGMLSQTQIMKFLNSNITMFPVHHMTVGESNIAKRGVHCIENTELLSNAFSLIKENRLSGLAVINSEGEILGNISGSDIKVVGYDAQLLHKLSKPISYSIGLMQDRLNVVTATPDQTIAEICQIFVEKHLHRLYVIDENQKPIGVISISDIMHIILDYC